MLRPGATTGQVAGHWIRRWHQQATDITGYQLVARHLEEALTCRLFLLQYHGNRLTLPRSPTAAAPLGPDEQDGTWYLIRADAPSHAFNHQRRQLASEPGHAGEGERKACPVEVLGNGALSDMLRLAARLGADVTPRPRAGSTRYHVPHAHVQQDRARWWLGHPT